MFLAAFATGKDCMISAFKLLTSSLIYRIVAWDPATFVPYYLTSDLTFLASIDSFWTLPPECARDMCEIKNVSQPLMGKISSLGVVDMEEDSMVYRKTAMD